MRRSIALVAAILTLSLGLIASAPAEAGGGYGKKHGFKHGYGHGFKHAYVHRPSHFQRRHYGHRRHGHNGDKFLAAVGIIAGAKVISAYLQPPPVHHTTVIYAAPPQPRPCYQVMVPYAHPYGGYYYAPQLQCY